MRDLRQSRGGSLVVRRQNVRLSGAGVPVMDMLDGSGRGVVACPVPVLGGSPESFAYFPPAEGTDTIAAVSEGAVGQILPTSAASWPSALDKEAHFEKDLPDISDSDDYPDIATPQDVVVKHGGVRVQISADGDLVIAAEKPVRVQLLQGAFVRVSLTDTDTSEHLLLSGPTVDVLNSLANKIDELNNRMMAVFTALGAETPTTIAAGMVPTKTAITALSNVPYVSAPQTTTDDVSSAAFVVSSQTVTEASGFPV